MSILRLSTLSLTLAIAVFALGYNPSLAKPKCDDPPCGGGGGGGGEDPATEFMVEMQPGDVSDKAGLVTSDGVACGTTEGETRPGGVGAVFPDDCVATVVYFITPPTGGPLTLKLWYVQVNLNKSNVKIWFLVDNQLNAYVTDSLPVEIIPDESSSSFTVDVNLPDLVVEKNHHPGKGDLVGPIAIGEIVYTPIE